MLLLLLVVVEVAVIMSPYGLLMAWRPAVRRHECGGRDDEEKEGANGTWRFHFLVHQVRLNKLRFNSVCRTDDVSHATTVAAGPYT
jgi:hypothetical protein